MRNIALLLMFGILFSFCAQADSLMMIENGQLKSIDGSKFEISVSGMAPTPGYLVRIVPTQQSADAWQLNVMGKAPDGFVIQVLTAYSASLKLSVPSSIKSIVLVGANKKITLNVPRLSAPSAPSSTTIAYLKLAPEEPGQAFVAVGDLFLVQMFAPKDLVLAQKPVPCEYFDFLAFYTYPSAQGVCHGYVCKMKAEASTRSFMVTVPGKNSAGEEIEASSQIQVVYK